MRIISWGAAAVAGVVLIILVIMGATRGPSAPSEAVSTQLPEVSEQVATPSEPAAESPEPTSGVYEFDPQPATEDMVEELNISDDPQPSTELVWRFEEAFLLADPDERSAALAELATAQYIAANSSSDEDRSGGATVVVDEENSTVEITVNSDKTAANVIATLTLLVMRDGEVVNTIPEQLHATYWVNTPDGWRVAQEK